MKLFIAGWIFLIIMVGTVSAFNFETEQNTIIAYSGNLSNLSQMADTNIPTPTDNYVLTWDAGTAMWLAEASAGGADTNASTACSGDEVLLGNGTCTSSADFGSGASGIWINDSGTAVYNSTQGTGNVDIENNLTVGEKIGIGLDTPESQIHFISDTTSSFRGLINGQHNDGAQAGTMKFFKSRGSYSSPSTMVDGDYFGVFQSWGYDGTDYQRTAQFGFRSNGAVATGSVPTDIIFWAGTNASNLNEGLRISSEGYVGINEGAPAYLLEVSGTPATTLVYVQGEIDVDDINYHSPALDLSYTSTDALNDLIKISDDGGGNLNHSTVPDEINKVKQRPIRENYTVYEERYNPDTGETIIIEENASRIIGYENETVTSMGLYLSLIQKSIQELTARWNIQDSRTSALETENQMLKDELCARDNTYSWCGPQLG